MPFSTRRCRRVSRDLRSNPHQLPLDTGWRCQGPSRLLGWPQDAMHLLKARAVWSFDSCSEVWQEVLIIRTARAARGRPACTTTFARAARLAQYSRHDQSQEHSPQQICLHHTALPQEGGGPSELSNTTHVVGFRNVCA